MLEILWSFLHIVWTIIYSILAIILFLILIAVSKFILKPLFHLYYYKRQGFKIMFFPIMGYGKIVQHDYNNHDDSFYSWKQGAMPKVFIANIADFTQITVSDKDIIKQFFLQQDKYIKFPGLSDMAKLVVGDGTLLSEGQIWKRHRKLTSAAFNYEYFKEMVPEIIEIVEELVEKLDRDKYGASFMVKAQEITGEIVGRLFFGEKFSNYQWKGIPVADYLTELMARTMVEQSSLFAFLLTSKAVKLGILKRHKKLLKDIKSFREFMLKLAKERLDETVTASKTGSPQRKRANLIDLFYNQRLKNPEDGFTDEEILNEFMTFFVAGMDTTGHLVALMSYYYLQNPSCQEKVLEEVKNTFTDPSKVTIDDLNQMNYMTAMVKETLRMTPAVPFLVARQATEDHKLGDLKVKAGTLVNIAFLALNYNPEVHEDPHSFKPERWLDENSSTRQSLADDSYLYIPFSSGSRTCLGQHLAMIEAKVIFGLFLKKFEYNHTYSDYKLVMRRRFLYEPVNPLWYTLKRREKLEKPELKNRKLSL